MPDILLRANDSRSNMSKNQCVWKDPCVCGLSFEKGLLLIPEGVLWLECFEQENRKGHQKVALINKVLTKFPIRNEEMQGKKAFLIQSSVIKTSIQICLSKLQGYSTKTF